jgi:DNA-binding NarL/FixJ family response regulator
MKSIKVFLADDHHLIRDGINNLLEGFSGIEVVGEAADGEEAYRQVLSLEPDVLILDVELPSLNGVELTEKLRAESPGVKILALSAYKNKTYISEMLALGASGYLVKDEVPKRLVDAIRGVAQGEQGWVSREVAQVLSRMALNENSDDQLTDRESEVLSHVVDGKTNREIGYALDISEKTVEKHLHSIYNKLDVRSRVEAAVLAVETGLIQT